LVKLLYFQVVDQDENVSDLRQQGNGLGIQVDGPDAR